MSDSELEDAIGNLSVVDSPIADRKPARRTPFSTPRAADTSLRDTSMQDTSLASPMATDSPIRRPQPGSPLRFSVQRDSPPPVPSNGPANGPANGLANGLGNVPDLAYESDRSGSPATPPDEAAHAPIPDKQEPEAVPKAEQTQRVRAFYDVAESLGLAKPHSRSPAVVISPHTHAHQYTRPWTSKKFLASIVERPERMNAAYMGIGAAHAVTPLQVVDTDRRVPLSAEHVVAVHGSKYLDQVQELVGQVKAKHLVDELEVPDDWPSGDIYLCSETTRALEGAVAAVETGVDLVFDDNVRRAFVAVRPPGHHCHEDEASGFCVINNAHIAIQYAKRKHKITHAVIFDIDLHHGDGSQDLLWKLGFENEGPAELPMAYFSLHDINSFPTERGYADPQRLSNASVCMHAHGVAIWNVHLQEYATLDEFNTLYEQRYSALFEHAVKFLGDAETQARADNAPFNPLIVISAGFDGSEHETQDMQRHKVHLPTSFYNRFARDSGALADRYAQGRFLSLMEGGYSTAAISTACFSLLTGISGVPYNEEWVDKDVAQEFEKGARVRWKAAGKAMNGIKLGRELILRTDKLASPPPPPTSTAPSGRILRSRRS